MPSPISSGTPPSAPRSEARDPFAAQVRLSRMHTRLVPMRSDGVGYSIDPAASGWFALPVSRGFAGYGLGRALGLLLDAMRGLSALNETTSESGEPFAHGEFTPLQLRVDPLGVCRLVPLTTRHYVSEYVAPPRASLGFLSPERLIAEKVGLRADVFSAGVLLWEALAGRRLIEADRAEVIVERLLSRKIRVPALPPQLDWATPLKVEVERALSVNQQRRFADCAEFSEVILRLVQDRVARHDEIAAFFATNFDASASGPGCQPVSPNPGSVFGEVPTANRGATIRMLPAVSLTPARSAAMPNEAGPPRHTTLKMNVTLKMPRVPLPLLDDQAADIIAPPAPWAPPALGAARPASPPLPLPSIPPARRSSPPPLPHLRRKQPSLPPPLPVAPSAPESLPGSTSPAPPLLELEEPEACAPAEPRVATQSPPELTLTTPVPTQLSLLHASSSATSFPPTATEPPPEPASVSSRKWPLTTLAVGLALVTAAAAAKKIAGEAAHASTASARSAAGLVASTAIGGSTSSAARARAELPHVRPSEDEAGDHAVPENRLPVQAATATPSAERSAAPASRPPVNRSAATGALPLGKDYGI